MTVYVRRDIWALAKQGGVWEPYTKFYALAVREMQSRSEDEPTSWLYQANIHGTYDPVPPGADWNQCQHASWWFLPWHRMYIFQFEAIVRAAVVDLGGPDDWALPYWNYSAPYPWNTLPPAFRLPTMDDGSPNALYVPQPQRNPLPAPGINFGAQLTPTTTSTTRAMGTPNFSPPPAVSFGGGKLPQPVHFDSATGALEAQPHNLVHVAVGGESDPHAPQDNLGWMTDPNLAARDPIFWLHHSNIDRLWEQWNAKGGQDPGDQVWVNQTFPLMDADGQPVTMRIGNILDPGTPGSEMNYRYDDQPEPEDRAARPLAEVAGGGADAGGSPREIAAAGPVELWRERESVPLEPKAGAEDAADAAPRGRVELALGDLEGHGGANYAVYLGEPSDDRFVGTISTFGLAHVEHEGHEHGHGHGRAAHFYDITELAQRLAAQGERVESLPVTFVPIELAPPPPDSDDARAQREAGAEDAPQEPPRRERPVRVGHIAIIVE